MSNKLTKWEWDGLKSGYNLADGHAHQPQSPVVVRKASKLLLKAEQSSQQNLQRNFEQAFFKASGQLSYTKLMTPLYQYACSLSIEAVANYLRANKKTVAMLHPTFDNLADILKRHNIPLTPIEESDILDPEHKLKNLKANVLFLVTPNNPTGRELTKKQFLAIVEYCRKNKKLLILDYSFRFYSSYTKWDQYKHIIASGIDFIIFEDTGKTWPTLELKVGITVASDSVYPYLKDITNDFLLNVSPFTFVLLTEYINANATKQATQNIEKNRKVLRAQVKNLPLEIPNPDSQLSVEWIKLPEKWKATVFCKWLGEQSVHVLPGNPFFWNDHERGEKYIRIALQRPQNKFKEAIQNFSKAVKKYEITSSSK